MLNIAILDDNITQLNALNKKVVEILNKSNISFKIDTFASGIKLVETFMDKQYDLYILDIQLGDSENGLSIATRINNINEEANIIYITAYPQYFTQVYETNHTYTILKDELDQRLESALKKVIQLRYHKYGEKLVVKTNHKVDYVYLKDILYLEKSLRKIRFILKNNSVVETYGKFEEFSTQLPSYFLQVHRSFIINTNYIHSFGKNTINLLNGSSIPVSRSYQKQVNEALVNIH